MSVRVLIPSGVLGLGFDAAALAKGLAAKPDIICIDGGSTDSGPFYLGTGTSKYARSVCKAEWRMLMEARAEIGVPLVIGSCGTCGADAAVDWMYDITREIAHELGQSVKVARLYSEQSAEDLAAAMREDRLRPLDPAPAVTEADLPGFSHIVALAGAEQINAALAGGADIVLAGRATDTAVISALPLARGMAAGAAWHGAKIGECGAFCSTRPSSGVIMIEFDEQGFTVEAAAEDALCTPYTVSAHMLYENADPFILHEPGGRLDVSSARCRALDERRVRVEGAFWAEADEYTVKLEGARRVGYQTTMLAVIRDARYAARAEEWRAKLAAVCAENITAAMGPAAENHTLEIRLIGVDAALGPLERTPANPAEIGVLVMITAETQDTATEIARLINPFLLHLPLSENEDMPTFAFPYSPAHSERGAVYEFGLNHTRVLTHPMEGFRLRMDEIRHAPA